MTISVVGEKLQSKGAKDERSHRTMKSMASIDIDIEKLQSESMKGAKTSFFRIVLESCTYRGGYMLNKRSIYHYTNTICSL